MRRFKQYYIHVFISVLGINMAMAHPGVGIVNDKYGNIYYTDLQHVWKITPNGKHSKAVTGVHTHELFIDNLDNLYGQHLLYSGETTNQFSYYVWKLSPTGNFDTVISPTNGSYVEDYSFVKDSLGNAYWIQHLQQDIIYKRSPDGKNKELYRGKLKNVQWMHYSNGTLFFIQDDDIYALNEQNGLWTYAKDMNQNQGNNTFFGLWSDKRGNLFVANYYGKKVQQVTPTGSVSDFWKSTNEWAPTGGTFDQNGQLWILLVNKKNEVDILKVPTDIIATSKMQVSYRSVAIALLLLTVGLFTLSKYLFKY